VVNLVELGRWEEDVGAGRFLRLIYGREGGRSMA
jgi:hypothetical protein